MKRQPIRIAEQLVDLLDNKFSIGGFRFGLDPLIGVFPVIGDFFAFLPALYFIGLGFYYKLPSHKISRMVWNIVIDFIFGSVPVIGVLADAVIKANQKNLRIIKDHLDELDGVIAGEIVR